MKNLSFRALYLISFLFFFNTNLATSIGTFDLIQNSDTSVTSILSLYLNSTDNFNLVLDHGCHCARFDIVSDKQILGGHNAVDELDQICKDWFHARACLDKFEDGTCLGLDASSFMYQVTIGIGRR